MWAKFVSDLLDQPINDVVLNYLNTLIGKVPNMIMNGVAINNASDAKEQKNNLSSQNGATVMGNTFVSDLGCS